MIIELATNKDVIKIADMYSRLYSHVYKKPDNVRKKEKLIKYVEVRLKWKRITRKKGDKLIMIKEIG